jgi:hypothetical protein
MPPLPPLVTTLRHWLLGPAFRYDPLRLIPERIQEYGEIFTVRVPLGQVTVVGSPELARQS